MKKRNIRSTKTTGSRRGMGRVALTIGDIPKKKRRRVTIKSKCNNYLVKELIYD